ncbi:hypothetical protein PV328_012096, partial [Microctonus aethiopoides]
MAMNEVVSSDESMADEETLRDFDAEAKSIIRTEILPKKSPDSEKLKPATLWCIWSMLKKTLNTIDNIDTTKFQNLKSLIKNNSKGYTKKSSGLQWNEIMIFMNSASDHTYLASKV